MERKRRQAKSRGMDGNWKSILKEGEREEGVIKVAADMQILHSCITFRIKSLAG